MKSGENARKRIMELLGREDDHFLKEGDVIRTEGLTKCFGNFTAVDHISLLYARGRFSDFWGQTVQGRLLP